MKKILVFSLAYYPSYVSGAEAAIKEITDRIDPNYIEFHMVTLRFEKSSSLVEEMGNVKVFRVSAGFSYLSKILFPFIAAIKAYRLHRLYQYDALWAMMTYMLLPVSFLWIFGLRIPYVLTLQDGDPYEKVFGRLRIKPFVPFLNYGFRNATVIQAISKYLAEWPRRRGYKGEAIIIHNGANPRDIKAEFDEAEIDKLKKELGKHPDDVYLMNTARLVHQKGNDTMIQALPHLPEYVKLVLVGGGEDKGMLKNLAQELNVADRVIFVGPVDRSVVSNYRQVADIFVGPSRSEGLGNAFLSAMASRLPVIATQVGGLAEFIFDEKRNLDKKTTGWAVDADSPEQIAEAVKDILANPEKVKKITETARNMVLEKFNWDTVANYMREKVFAKVL